jgi:hypothetical protein
MKCGVCEKRLSAWLAGELSGDEEAAVRAHLDGCRSCAHLFEEQRATLALLHRMGGEELPADFGASLHARLVAAGPPPRGSRLSTLAERLFGLGRPLAFAAAGALAVALVVGVRVGPRRHAASSPPEEAVAAGPVEPVFRVPQAKFAVVRIDFVAEQAVDDVDFTISLPEGLHFVSDGQRLAEREVRWHGRLEKGSNSIPIVIGGERAGRYTVAASAVGSDVDAKQKVMLEVISG